MSSCTAELTELVVGMLKENTGSALCDSGSFYGRHHEQNANVDFEKTVQVSVYDTDGAGCLKNETTVDGIEYTVSLYHALTSGVLELDDFCTEFNQMQVEQNENNGRWGDLFYGVYENNEEFFDNNDFTVDSRAWNTYNGECTLSQTLQGINLEGPNGDRYILLQVHGGCDVRGGYTDAKLFKVNDYVGGIDACPSVNGSATLPDGTVFNLRNEGYRLEAYDDDGDTLDESPELPEGTKIELFVSDY